MLSRFFTRREQAILLALAGAIAVGSLVLYARRGVDARLPTTVEPGSAVSVEPPEAPPEIAHFPPPPPEATEVAEAPVERVEAPAKRLRVGVAGLVALPGVYDMREDDRIQDLLERAGGALDGADMRDINLAARLIDGTTLTIAEDPRKAAVAGVIRREEPVWAPNPPQYTLSGWRPESAPVAAVTAGAIPSSAGAEGRINLNTATQQELETLPGIGPAFAERIIAYRTQTPFRSVEELTNISGIGPKRYEAIRDLVSVN